MHLEILCEDKSGSIVIEHLVKKILQQEGLDCTYAIRAHRGKGRLPEKINQAPAKMASGLMDLLPAKIKAYKEVFAADELILILVMDGDDDDAVALYLQLEGLIRKLADQMPYIIGISVEEIEAWLLGDKEAILEAYPQAHSTVIDNYVQDSICGTWELLARALYGKEAKKLIKIGYPAVGRYKFEWAEKIASVMEPSRNKSPSFRRFYRRFLRIIKLKAQ